MANEIGNVRGITGKSVSLNNQAGQGAVKPMPTMKDSPNGCKPDKPADASVPMPK